MKEKLLDVEVQYVHDQGQTAQFKFAGFLSDTREQVERTVDHNTSLNTHERLLLTLVVARLTNAKLESVTINDGAVVGVAM